jgi:hypothetical protein
MNVYRGNGGTRHIPSNTIVIELTDQEADSLITVLETHPTGLFLQAGAQIRQETRP